MVEDIQYLYENSTKKSYMFYVDSKDRDRFVYPHPNTYAITFSAPFKNVYSLEILDASIPRTQYAIDTHNNMLVYKYDNTINNINIPIGDYNSNNLIIAINNSFNNAGHNIFIDNLSLPADERMTFVFKSDKFFILDMQKSTVASVLGFDLLAHQNVFDDQNNIRYNVLNNIQQLHDIYDSNIDIPSIPIKPDKSDYSVITLYESDLEAYLKNMNQYNQEIDILRRYQHKIFCSTTNEPESGSTETTGIQYYHENNDFIGPLNVNRSFNLSTDGNYNSIGQTVTITENSKIHSIQIHFNDNNTVDYNIDFYRIDDDGNMRLEPLITVHGDTVKAPGENLKTHKINDTRSDLIHTRFLIGLHVHDGDTDVAINFINTPSSDETMFVFNTTLDGELEIVNQVDILNDGSQNVGPGVTGTVHMCMNVSTKTLLHKIEAPGMYSLIGDRYTILRCPEIEQHLFASHSFEKYSMGLAKFKLAVLGYDESRFDFATLPPRKFHPIGKLTHMTFRFERPDQSLYNFRGVNHTITIAIRYLVPKQKSLNFDKYVLNPDYDPDFFRYQQNEDSDHELSD